MISAASAIQVIQVIQIFLDFGRVPSSVLTGQIQNVPYIIHEKISSFSSSGEAGLEMSKRCCGEPVPDLLALRS